MFPQLTPEVIKNSVLHASNRFEPLDEGHLLQRCIDDLLDLRTYTLESSFEEPHEGSSDNDILMTGARAPRSTQGHHHHDVIFISESPQCEDSKLFSPLSVEGTNSDHRLMFNVSPPPMETHGPMLSQGPAALIGRVTMQGSTLKRRRNSQSISVSPDYDDDLPDIRSPVVRHNTSAILSSNVTHNAPRPSTSELLSATTYNNAPVLTAAAITHNAPLSPSQECRRQTGATNVPPVPSASTSSVIQRLAGATNVPPVPSASTSFVNQRPAGATNVPPVPSASTSFVNQRPAGATNVPPVPSTSTSFVNQRPAGATNVPPVPSASTSSVNQRPAGATNVPPVPSASTSSVNQRPAGATNVPPVPSASTSFVNQRPAGATNVPPVPSASTSFVNQRPAGATNVPPVPSASTSFVNQRPAGATNVPPVPSASTSFVNQRPAGATNVPPVPSASTSSVNQRLAGATNVPPVPSASTSFVNQRPAGATNVPLVPSASTSSVNQRPAGATNVPPVPSASTSYVSQKQVGAINVQTIPLAAAEIPVTEPLVVPSTKPKSREENLEDMTQEVCAVFTDADRDYVKDLLRHSFFSDPVNAVCNYMLEENNYLRAKKSDPIPLEENNYLHVKKTDHVPLGENNYLSMKPDPILLEENHQESNYICPKKPVPVPLQESNYIRTKKPDSVRSTASSSTTQSMVTRRPEVDYYEYRDDVSTVYRNNCITQLQYDFNKIASRSIQQVASRFEFHYAPTRRALLQAEQSFTPLCQTIMLQLPDELGHVPVAHLKGKRNYKFVDISACPELQEEVAYVKQDGCVEEKNVNKPVTVSLSENINKPVTVSASEEAFPATEETIECGCCYDDCCFENMVQCSDGHLFCMKCVENYTRESVFGQGKANLVCMTDSCEAIFPKSQLEIALPPDLLSQFEARMQEEAINLAAMADLVRCPHCDFAAILDPGDKVFKCLECHKETCRYCKENWAEHIGIPCEELEKKDETKIRLAFEEKMTEAKIRVCHQCKARFTKLDGCNKMTCRCGARMCYICRKPNIDYNHFCQHVRDPGHSCKKCKVCSLWTNPDEDEERAIVELKKEAQLARQEQGYTDDKVIGTNLSPVKKKRRVN
ncbi:hypothetical protein LSAT2_004235 [Lamellibrachia satsuma]|nr:hypothetical protein LSAT2_004235 [Lamellibrachia satsuma]